MPKFPDAKVKLVGEDGNAFSIISRTRVALKKAGATPAEIAQFTDEATNGDYSHVIVTVGEWASVR